MGFKRPRGGAQTACGRGPDCARICPSPMGSRTGGFDPLLMRWTAPRTASSVPRWWLLKAPSGRRPSMGKSIIDTSAVTRVGLDLAKRVFRVHAVDATGKVVILETAVGRCEVHSV